ncbi:glycosyltransferase [Rhodopirellula halodulae]|nr:glycosyltransferase [Rhodopirellula sp. JC740]
MSRCRVLLMASSMRGGGSEWQTALLAKHLDREKFEVHLYLTQAEGDLLWEIPSDVQAHHPPGSFPPSIWDRLPGGMLRRQAQWFGELTKSLDADVIYDRTFHMTLLAGHPSAEKASGRARPRVSTIVSPPHVALPMVEKRFVALKRRYLAAAYRRSFRVIAVSDAARQSAIDFYGLPASSIQTIRNPVDVEAVRVAAKRGSAPTDDADGLRLAVVGRMTEEKGHATLLQAIERLMSDWPEEQPPMQIRLIGDGPLRDDLQRQWRDIVLRAGPQDILHHVEFAGVIQPASGEIAASDGMILPSHFEGMPNVVLEAFALGVPVIATRAGGTVELQSSESEPTCFWADPRAPDSLARAIREFVVSPGERQVRRGWADRWVRQHHDLSDAVARISEQLLLAGSLPPASS